MKPVEFNFSKLLTSNITFREKVNILENELRKFPQIEQDLTHRFADGLYSRELFIPKGSLITGKIHKFEHLSFFTKGEITLMTEADGVRRLKAPMTLISKPGTKRIFFTHEDTIWTTVHATREVDVETLEAHLVAETFEEFELFLLEKSKAEKCLSSRPE